MSHPVNAFAPLCHPGLREGSRGPHGWRLNEATAAPNVILRVWFRMTGRLCLATLALLALPALAAAERLDDSQSPRHRVESAKATLNATLFDDVDPTHAGIAFGWVEYRLNTKRYVGKKSPRVLRDPDQHREPDVATWPARGLENTQRICSRQRPSRRPGAGVERRGESRDDGNVV